MLLSKDREVAGHHLMDPTLGGIAVVPDPELASMNHIFVPSVLS